MATSSKNQNKVTLLHKGFGPGLFQYRSQPFPLFDNNVGLNSSRSSEKSPAASARKRIVMKCREGQDTNSMFTKRLRERDPNYRNSGRQCCGVISTKREVERELQRKRSEMGFGPTKNVVHTPRAFPPPNFMPRWNPRHKDRTYLDKMVLEDPWSLPAEKRAELQRKTGLRLKSISKHYQFKVASNLPYGKDALGRKCICHVDFCEHCSKSNTYRCPLHMQLLGPIESDCKTEVLKLCSLTKAQPEDMALADIQDVSVYVSEVVRRLKAGEISEAPAFPARFSLKAQSAKSAGGATARARNKSTIPLDAGSNAGGDTSVSNSIKKIDKESAYAQTEPFDLDVDMKGNSKDNVCQTNSAEKEEPMMLSVLKLVHEAPFRGYPVEEEKGVQVTPFDICGFQDHCARLVEKLARMIIEQGIRELNDEMNVKTTGSERNSLIQQYADTETRLYYKLLQENHRFNANLEASIRMEQQMAEEALAERLVGVIAFAQSIVGTMPTRVMDALRRSGTVTEGDLEQIKTKLTDELNEGVRQKLVDKENAVKLLDEIIVEASENRELGFLRRHLTEKGELAPTLDSTKALREMVELREETITTLKKIRAKLLKMGWEPASIGSSSEESLDLFLEKVRVSLDSKGEPKYLVDEQGKALPINISWMPALKSHLTGDDNNWDSKKTFNIVLGDDSKSSNSSLDDGSVSSGGRSSKDFNDQNQRSSVDVFDDDYADY